MDKYVICTLGTSIANKLGDVLSDKQRKNGKWDDSDPEFEKTLHSLVDGILNGKDDFSTFSAESAILKKIGLSDKDKVVLLATDSYLGKVCAAETARLIANGFGLLDDAVEKVRVEGLQVADAECLRRTGLPNFVRDVIRRIEANRYQCEITLCPVGGYKGIVPFLTALGMVYHLPVLYTFEHINSLVRLPALPFSLDMDLYARAKPALVELGRRIEMPEREFLARITGFEEDERDQFLAFVESGDKPGFVTPSYFTETFAPDFECDTAPLSEKALEDLELISHGQFYRTACKMVIGAQDKGVRSQWTHTKTPSTDLEILKQGGNTNVRLLGYRNGNRFYVCRILLHSGSYDKKLDNKILHKADFPEDSFVEWSLPQEEPPDSVKDAESPYDAIVRQLAESERKLADTISEWAAKVNEQKEARVACEKGIATVQRQLEGARLSLDDLKREKQSLERRLADMTSKAGSLERERKEALDDLAKANGQLDEIAHMGFFARLFQWRRVTGYE